MLVYQNEEYQPLRERFFHLNKINEDDPGAADAGDNLENLERQASQSQELSEPSILQLIEKGEAVKTQIVKRTTRSQQVASIE